VSIETSQPLGRRIPSSVRRFETITLRSMLRAPNELMQRVSRRTLSARTIFATAALDQTPPDSSRTLDISSRRIETVLYSALDSIMFKSRFVVAMPV